MTTTYHLIPNELPSGHDLRKFFIATMAHDFCNSYLEDDLGSEIIDSIENNTGRAKEIFEMLAEESAKMVALLKQDRDAWIDELKASIDSK